MVEVWINGFKYYADITNKILYIDSDKKSGTPFNFLSKNESEQLFNQLRFPRKNDIE